MQILDRKNIEKRILFYWSKMYTSSIKSSMDYSELQKGIVILISSYNLDNLLKIPDFITKWTIREEKYGHLILTDALEIYIIETEKAKNYLTNEHTELISWLQFINNPEAIVDMENEEIKKAKKVLEEISQDEREQRLTELREKYIMDQKAIHDHGYDKGLEEGMKQGLTQGIETGTKKEKLEIAKKMKIEKIDLKTIEKVTGLTEEEINKI